MLSRDEPDRNPASAASLPQVSSLLHAVDAGDAGDAAPARKMILVADDSSAVRQFASRVLGEAGYDVMCAVDGIAALALLGEHAADLLVCDVIMPRLDGLQACTLLRRHPRYTRLPVVMLSTRQGLFDRARCAMAGADEFLGKPFSEMQLLQAVRAYADGVEEV